MENVITTKGLQDRNNLLLDERTVEHKGKLILKEFYSREENELNQTDKWKETYNLCLAKLQFQISRQKFEPLPSVEPDQLK